MAMRYGYFDSEITGVDSEGMPIFDRAETSELFRLLFSKLITNGVLAKPGDCFQVLAGDNGLSIKVRPGFGMINGAFAYDASEAAYPLAAAPTTHSRIDRVVLRCDYLNRLCEIAVKTGTPASTPAPPDLIQPTSGDCYELGLALVTIGANQSVITQSSIRDTRSDSSVCGYITQLIDSIDTDVFYAQLSKFMDEFEESSEARFSSWFNEVKGQLDEDAAGHLQNQIDDLKDARISDLTEMPETDLADTTVISSENTDRVTKKTKLSSLFSWIYSKLSGYFLKSYSEIMACTKDGFVPTALGVKEGFEQLNTNKVNKSEGTGIPYIIQKPQYKVYGTTYYQYSVPLPKARAYTVSIYDITVLGLGSIKSSCSISSRNDLGVTIKDTSDVGAGYPVSVQLTIS